MTDIFETPEDNQEEVELTIEEVILKLNELLQETASDSAEQAFGVSCLMSIVVIVVIAVVTFFISHWLTAVIVLTFGGLVGLGISSLMSSFSRDGNLKLTFQRDIKPKIEKTLDKYDLRLDEFLELVHNNLPEGTPLVDQIKQQSYGSE